MAFTCQKKTAVCCLLLSLITGSVSASDFSEAFSAFVFGAAAERSASQAAKLPVGAQAEQCIACHNGSRAMHIALKRADSPLHYAGARSADHPVGMYYANYVRQNPATYVAMSNLDPRVTLENGAVTCITCHETRSKPQHRTSRNDSVAVVSSTTCSATSRLTTGSSRSQLCMSCHAM